MDFLLSYSAELSGSFSDSWRMHSLALVCAATSLTSMGIAAAHDLATRAVPNRLIAVIAGSALFLANLEGRLPASCGVAVLLLVITSLLWLRGYIGGADAKLLAAAGLLVAPVAVIPMLLATALAGGVLCLPYLLGPHLLPRPKPGRPTRLLSRLLRCELWRLRRGGPLPYAVAIAAGTIFAMHGA